MEIEKHHCFSVGKAEDKEKFCLLATEVEDLKYEAQIPEWLDKESSEKKAWICLLETRINGTLLAVEICT